MIALLAVLYLLSGAVLLAVSLWIIGDLGWGKRIVLTSRTIAAVLLWPAALLWLIGAVILDVVQHLRRP